MSALTTDVVRMGNQLVDQYPHLTSEDRVAAVARHIDRFWEKRMVAALLTHIASGAEDVDPELVAAARTLRP